MKKIMMFYPPGKAYQRSEDRAQCNIDESAVVTVHACNDLGYAAAVLKKRGYSVLIRDYQTEKTASEEVKKEILSFDPDIMVISTTNGTIKYDLEYIKWITSFHQCEFIFKGAVFFNAPAELLKIAEPYNVNYLIGWEIDTVIGDLTDSIFNGNKNIDNIPGIVYRDNGVFRKTNFEKWCKNLDDIPFPARDLMKNELYVRPDTGEPMATIQVSRGCPAGCTYCLTPVISGRAVRKRSIENIFAEIEECYYKYGIKNFFFKADTFTIDSKWAIDLCDRIIDSDLHGKIEFTVNSRASDRNEELYRKLKEAGCFMIAVGFESSSDKTLKLIKKGTTRSDNILAAKLIKKSGLPLFGFFMIGFPWESKEDIEDTLSFVFDIDPDFVEVHIAMPYYGTEFYTQCRQYGTVADSAWGYDYFSPNTVGTKTVPMKEIQKIRNKYLLKFYLRPGYITKKIIRSLYNPVIIKNYFRHGIKLIKNIFKNSSIG